jgi:acetyl esterase
MARDRGAPAPVFQLLIYPGINLDLQTPERTAMGEKGWILTPAFVDWLNSFYCADPGDWQKDYCVPVRSKNLTGLPPARLIVGTCDPLVFEVKDYARRLEASGVPTHCSEYAGAVHGFISGYSFIATARAALDEAAAALKDALRTAA